MSTPVFHDLGIYYRIKYYQSIMLKKRGYLLSPGEERLIELPLWSDVALHHFQSLFVDPKVYIKDKLGGIYTHGISKKKINVIYVKELDPSKKKENIKIVEEDTKLLKHNVDYLKYQILKDNIPDVIAISRINISTENKKFLDDLKSFNITFFIHEELYYDCTNHILVPQITILTSEEKAKFLERPDNLKIKKFRVDDPVVKFLGGKPGDIARIDRMSRGINQVKRVREFRLIENKSIHEDEKKIV